MVSFRYGGKNGKEFQLQTSDDLMVVRSRSRMLMPQAPLGREALGVLGGLSEVMGFASAGVQVMRAAGASAAEARSVLGRDEEIEFAGKALVDAGSGEPVVYTENMFIKFHDDVKAVNYLTLLRIRDDLGVKGAASYAKNGFYLRGPKGIGQNVFDLASTFLNMPEVELCHPELVRKRSWKKMFQPQWHLGKTQVDGQEIDAHASVEAAWSAGRGQGTIVAVIDDGVDYRHPEFSARGKVVHPYDATAGTDSAFPRHADENHGTACAGVACASGVHGASGVAPDARLMPIRLASGLGSFEEADAFHHAWSQGADVISCSWGPTDGDWWDPSDPLHHAVVPLPDSTRLAIHEAVTKGRKGKGCVVTFAAGNGNESADNDGYASNPDVIAVAACNDMATRSAYSDFGDCVWCCFPSSHGYKSKTPGIWTTDRTNGAGYNPGGSLAYGDVDGLYTKTFGGTSSACPGVAGTVALMMSVAPMLAPSEIRAILKETATKIDQANGNYGADGHSKWYGHGRINALEAVLRARG